MAVNYYETWFNLADTHKDLEFARVRVCDLAVGIDGDKNDAAGGELLHGFPGHLV